MKFLGSRLIIIILFFLSHDAWKYMCGKHSGNDAGKQYFLCVQSQRNKSFIFISSIAAPFLHFRKKKEFGGGGGWGWIVDMERRRNNLYEDQEWVCAVKVLIIGGRRSDARCEVAGHWSRFVRVIRALAVYRRRSVSLLDGEPN